MLNGLARVGFVARGIVYIIVGVLAVALAFGRASHTPDRLGALETIATKPFGYFVLWLLVFGFAGLALWRYAQAFLLPHEEGVGTRLVALAKAVIYTFVFWGTLNFVLDRGDPDTGTSEAQDFTSRLLNHDYGQVLVAVIGLAIMAGGLWMMANGLRRRFMRHLRTGWMSEGTRRTAERLGMAGYAARGLLIAAIGFFVFYAGVTYDSAHAKGVDAVLLSFTHTDAGPWLLALVAVGLMAFGVYSTFEARWRRTLGGVPR